ncbi:hypothetical protein [Flavobacterium sp.]|jgi:hypothetical protein|uniref:hypothetical protein n=1 Tax=Flavobacterium sp. TaxID=239 RepID=UPI0037C142B6
MDVLDLLKKDWKKKEHTFDQVSENEIYSMLHKRSSSIVKWILIISILEFVILNGLGFVISNKEIENFEKLHPYLNLVEKANYFILLGFIYLFYKNYKSISVMDSSKKLLQDIFKTRKTVNFYIYWNIFISCFLGTFGVIDGFNKGIGASNNSNADISTLAYVLIFGISLLLVFGLIIGFYKLLYGILLHRLNKNYKELQKMDL